MHFSLEVRVPFLNTKIADFTLGLDEDWLNPSTGETKWILRKAFKKIVPDDVLWQTKKIGFEVNNIILRKHLVKLTA